MATELAKAGIINTFDDLMNYTYEGNYAEQYIMGTDVLRSPGFRGSDKDLMSVPAKGIARQLDRDLDLKKADDPYLTSKTNYFNPIYGRTAVNWLNMESDIWKLLRKTTYQALGGSVRIITAEQITNKGYITLEEALSDLPGFQFRNIHSHKI